MKKIYQLLLTGLFLILFTNAANAQLTGTKNIPGDYATLATAITDLNTQGVGVGGVVINIIAGNPQTAPAGGYLLGNTTLNASTSAANSITLNGNANLITAPVGTTTSLDGIFIIRGTDYVTINNLNLTESAANATATTGMEYGYAFFNLNSAAPFDGCQNNTIQNCTVTLKRTVATASKAIFLAHQVYTSTTGLLPTATADMHNNNRFYTNTLTNCITGIYIGGATSANDTGNDIGGSSAATGNTMTNVIGALYSSVGAVTCTYQTNCNISYNTINNTASGGTNSVATSWGIYAYGPGCTYTVNNNNITLTEAAISAAYAIYGIYGNAALANITASNNVVTVSEVSGSAVNNIGIFLPNGFNTTISSNTVTQNMALNGLTYGIYITSTGAAVISSNTLKQTSTIATNSQFYSIVSGGTATVSETIQNNVFDNSNVSITGTAGFMVLIYTANGTGNKTISGNSINGTITHTSAADFYAILDNPASAPASGTAVYSNNNFSNIVKSGTGGVFGLYVAPTVANSRNNRITGNTISNITHSGAGSLVGTYYATGNNDSIYNNQLFSLTGAGSVFGIYGTSPAAVNAKVFKNQLYNLTCSSVTGGVFGITVADGTTNTIFNNTISGFQASLANNAGDVIRGISLLSTAPNSTINVYHNSIYLDAASSGTDFSTSGIFHTVNATATTAALIMINNIIVNTSTPNGTGIAAAYRRSGTSLGNFASGSDYNLLYAGTPSASKLIFYDGTNSDQTLAAYQARVTTMEANSISAMPAFVSATDLHLTTTNCDIDGRGVPVAAVADDIDAQTRDVAAPDMGADEFSAVYSNVLAGSAGIAVCTDKTVSPLGTTYSTSSCTLIAHLLPSGGSVVNGKVDVCVTLDATVQYFNGEPYVQRHHDMEPVISPSTATGTITLYYNNAEFINYNILNPVWPPMPTAGAGNTVANRNNVRITQFHGTPTGGLPTTTPGNYTGTRVLITPGAANVVWNGSYWAVTFDVTGFSGFYAHTTLTNSPLPITVNYLNGRKQGSNHLLDWKVTCVSTPRATMTLERSSDARNYTGIYTIVADAARCAQPFDNTDTNPLKGMNYYRLKIVDVDGKVTYSTTVALLNAVKGFDIISIAPNPVVSNNFKLNVASAQAGKMDIVIFDMQGRLVNRQTLSLIAGFNSIPVNVANLSSGTYTIRGAITDDQSKTIRFVKQ